MPPPEQTICRGHDSSNQTVLEDGLGFDNLPPVIGGGTTEDRITNLERAFLSFSQVSNERIARVERSLGELVSLMRQQQRPTLAPQLSHSLHHVHGPGANIINNSNMNNNWMSKPQRDHDSSPSKLHQMSDGDVSLPSTDSGVTAPTCSPVVCPNSPHTELEHAKTSMSKLLLVNVEKKWYTKRPFPEFEVRMVSTDTNRVLQHTSNHQVRLRLLSGTGCYADQILNAPLFVFSLVNGRCTVSGVRFSAVSSRNGGFFQFELSLCAPQDTAVAAVRSQEIRVLSERLKNEPKADNISELHSGDSLVRVPGIGKKYAARFRELGLMSISDLAAVNHSEYNGKQRRELLEAVRKDRGALTEAKLNDLIKDAQSVVDRDQCMPTLGGRGQQIDGDDDDDDCHSSDSETDLSPNQKDRALAPTSTVGHKHPMQGDVANGEPMLKRIKFEPAPFSIVTGPLMTPRSLFKLTPTPQKQTQTQSQPQATTLAGLPFFSSQNQLDVELENVKSRINNNNNTTNSMINDSCEQSGEIVTCLPGTIGSDEFSDFNVDSMLNLASSSSSSMFSIQDVESVDSWL